MRSSTFLVALALLVCCVAAVDYNAQAHTSPPVIQPQQVNTDSNVNAQPVLNAGNPQQPLSVPVQVPQQNTEAMHHQFQSQSVQPNQANQARDDNAPPVAGPNGQPVKLYTASQGVPQHQHTQQTQGAPPAGQQQPLQFQQTQQAQAAPPHAHTQAAPPTGQQAPPVNYPQSAGQPGIQSQQNAPVAQGTQQNIQGQPRQTQQHVPTNRNA